MVLSATSTPREFLEDSLKEGMDLTLLVTVPQTNRPILTMVGGLPLLIQDGKINIDNKREQIRDSFVTDKHPRTALGISKDGEELYLFVIDGRQPALSIGADLNEVAEYLKEMGAYQAMNLDGGGSSTMWVRGEIVNRPSDKGGERTVTNSLLVVSKTSPGTPDYMVVYPKEISAAIFPIISYFSLLALS